MAEGTMLIGGRGLLLSLALFDEFAASLLAQSSLFCLL